MRKALESLYQDTCNIYIFEKVTSELTGTTKFERKLLEENVPCRISFKTLNSTTQTDGVAIVHQIVKLFLKPELEVPSNSEIEVTRNGRTEIYKCSGQPAFYNNHQEITLQLKNEES